MQFHENLKRICTERGTSPTAVLRELGITTSKIASWNKGNLPKQGMLVQLAKHLNCSVMDFFWDESDDARLDTMSEYTAPSELETRDDDEVDILRIYRSLDRRDRHAFMAMVYDFEKKAGMQGDKASTNRSAV